jgi:hypothetical protein
MRAKLFLWEAQLALLHHKFVFFGSVAYSTTSAGPELVSSVEPELVSSVAPPSVA